MRLKFVYFILLFTILNFFTTFKSQIASNSELSNEQIEKKIDSYNDDPTKMWELITYYIKRSKKEKNNQALFYAYRYASMSSTYPQNIKYADSALLISKESGLKKIVLDAYLNRGNINMSNEFYQKALSDILIANKLSQESGSDYIFNKTIYYIAQNKIYLGQYEDANKELEICLKFFKEYLHEKTALGKNYEMYYMYSLMSLIDSNTKLNKFTEKKILLKEAFDYIKKTSSINTFPILFLLKELTLTIPKITKLRFLNFLKLLNCTMINGNITQRFTI